MASTRTKAKNGRRLLPAVVATLCAFAVAGLAVQAATKREQGQASARNVKNSFQVRGQVSGELLPGRRLPVKIEIASNKSYPLWITRLRISAVIDHDHRLAGCSVARDFRFTQLSKKSFPFKLEKRKFRVVRVKSRGKFRKKRQAVFKSLSRSVTRGRPTIELVNLSDVNQDACKGAKVYFKFDGRAERKLKLAKRRAGR